MRKQKSVFSKRVSSFPPQQQKFLRGGNRYFFSLLAFWIANNNKERRRRRWWCISRIIIIKKENEENRKMASLRMNWILFFTHLYLPHESSSSMGKSPARPRSLLCPRNHHPSPDRHPNRRLANPNHPAIDPTFCRRRPSNHPEWGNFKFNFYFKRTFAFFLTWSELPSSKHLSLIPSSCSCWPAGTASSILLSNFIPKWSKGEIPIYWKLKLFRKLWIFIWEFSFSLIFNFLSDFVKLFERLGKFCLWIFKLNYFKVFCYSNKASILLEILKQFAQYLNFLKWSNLFSGIIIWWFYFDI